MSIMNRVTINSNFSERALETRMNNIKNKKNQLARDLFYNFSMPMKTLDV